MNASPNNLARLCTVVFRQLTVQILVLTDVREPPAGNMNKILDVVSIPILGCADAQYVSIPVPLARNMLAAIESLEVLLQRFRHLKTVELDTDFDEEWEIFLRKIFAMMRLISPSFVNVRVQSTVNIPEHIFDATIFDFIRLNEFRTDQSDAFMALPMIVHFPQWHIVSSKFLQRLRQCELMYHSVTAPSSRTSLGAPM